MTDSITYSGAGVDQHKTQKILSSFASFLKSRPRDPNLLHGIGPFAACYELEGPLTRFARPVLVATCDGVGTKVRLAVDWDHLDGLGQDLVAMNVNDLLCMGAEPLLFLDYYGCGKLREEQLSTILESIQRACEFAGCVLAGGETAEMPGLYQTKDFDLAGFAVGLASKDALLGSHRVLAGDKVIAIESSGIHSNGFSLVRVLVEREKIDPDLQPDFCSLTWRELLLTPTRIYGQALQNHLPKLHGLAHITGGGLFENLGRVVPPGHQARVGSSRWDMPPLFQWLQAKSRLGTEQMLATFNCGAGMIAVCSPTYTTSLVTSLNGEGFRAWEVGEIVEASGSSPAVLWV